DQLVTPVVIDIEYQAFGNFSQGQLIADAGNDGLVGGVNQRDFPGIAGIGGQLGGNAVFSGFIVQVAGAKVESQVVGGHKDHFEVDTTNFPFAHVGQQGAAVGIVTGIAVAVRRNGGRVVGTVGIAPGKLGIDTAEGGLGIFHFAEVGRHVGAQG